MNPAQILRYAAAAAGAGLAGFGVYAAVAWARYGRADPRRHPRDELLDRFMPNPEVDEYHRLKVRAPATVTFAAARQMDIQAAPVVKGIFWLRAVPSLLQGEPFRPRGSRGIVAETLDQGWGVLAEVPDREIVVGAYTQPWHEDVTFRPLSPEEFAAFSEPGYVEIVWTLAAEPAGTGGSWFITRTRVATTDAESPEEVPPLLGADVGGNHPHPLRRPAPGPQTGRTAGTPCRQSRLADSHRPRRLGPLPEPATARREEKEAAMAPRPELDAGPKPITPGPQMQALARFWRPVIEYAHVPAERFRDFGEPGYAKTVYALSVCPLADGRSLLAGLMRTATTDEHARRWFRRYWTFGAGSGAHILVRALLELVRETVERAHTAAQEQAG